MIRKINPTVFLYVILAAALGLVSWAFIQSERYRYETNLALTQTYEIQWRSTQIRERLARTAGYLRLAAATGEIDAALDREVSLIGVNVGQLIALEYVDRFLDPADVALLNEVDDIVRSQIGPVVNGEGDFGAAVEAMDQIEGHMFEFSSATVAHTETLNETSHIAAAATRNTFLFAGAIVFAMLGIIIAVQRLQFAARRDQQLRSFSSLFAHMTRSRIVALRLFHDQLENDDPASPEMFDAASRAVKELYSINDRLLRMAHSDMDQKSARLADLLPNIVGDHETDIELAIEPTARDISVPATQVELVVDELITNAVAALGEKDRDEAKISIQAKIQNRCFPLPSRLRLDVTDNGIGMEPSVIENATSPFFSTKAGSHAGLGLTGCAQMVRAMRGKFHIRSKPGLGTVASIILPTDQFRAQSVFDAVWKLIMRGRVDR